MDTPPKTSRRVTVQGLAPARKIGGVEPASSPTSTSAPTPAAPAVPCRIGHGYDIHKLKEGGKLVLGGVVISDQMSAIAHSDGDVVIHAIVDALLGAIGSGDIGEQFSNQDDAFKGADSSTFLRTIFERVRQRGYRVVNVDVTILAERPRLAPFKLQMRQTLRQLMGGSADVNIKAGTNEGCDAIGRGEAIAAHAVVLLAGEG